jgi:hypothetical protein
MLLVLRDITHLQSKISEHTNLKSQSFIECLLNESILQTNNFTRSTHSHTHTHTHSCTHTWSWHGRNVCLYACHVQIGLLSPLPWQEILPPFFGYASEFEVERKQLLNDIIICVCTFSNWYSENYSWIRRQKFRWMLWNVFWGNWKFYK